MKSGFLRPEAVALPGHTRILYLGLFILSIAIRMASATAFGAEVTLQWDASEGAHGYVLHYGVQSNNYDSLIDVGPDVQHTVTDLEDGVSYFFAVTAYNEVDESGLSAEVTYATNPNQPPTANAGADMSVEEATTVRLDGSDSFDPDDGIKTLYWEQLSGPAVELGGRQEEVCQFVAPSVGSGSETLVFQVVVQDYGDQVASATCRVTVTAGANQPPPDEGGGNETPVDAVAIDKAVYRTSKNKLILQARIDGDSAGAVLTAWALDDGHEIELGKLSYRTARGYYRSVFRNLDRAPERIIVTSSTGAEASSSCTIRR